MTTLPVSRHLHHDDRVGEELLRHAAPPKRLGTVALRIWATVTVVPVLAVLGAIAYTIVTHHPDSPAGYGG